MIPTLCRYDHLVKCIESLKNNSYACRYDIYIGLDYPSKDEHLDGYNRIVSYLDKNSFDCFNSFQVIKRNQNYGSKKNEVTLLEEYILPYYDMWCRTDDDVVFSKNFLEYMYKNLEKYKDDENVMAISGYSYPCNYVVSDNANVFFQNYHVPMWGVGFWKNKFMKMREDIVTNKCIHRKFDYYIKNKSYINLIDARYIDFIDAGLSWQSEKFVYSMTDIAITIYCGLLNKYVVYPVVSKAQNNGFDGSGVTCQVLKEDTEVYKINKQKIDVAYDFNIIEDQMMSKDNLKVINAFDSRSPLRCLKSKMKLLLYLLIGRERYKMLWLKINGNKYEKLLGD